MNILLASGISKLVHLFEFLYNVVIWVNHVEPAPCESNFTHKNIKFPKNIIYIIHISIIKIKSYFYYFEVERTYLNSKIYL